MKEKWLEGGYAEFAKVGPELISINNIAKDIGASRSSFYHHFAEIDLFVDELLGLHWEIFREYNKAGKESCKNLIPDLYDLLAAYPLPLQFSWQLFRNRHIARFNYVFAKTYEVSSKTFTLDLFAKHIHLPLPNEDLNSLFLTLCEAWYSRLDPKDLSAETLSGHAQEILQDLTNFMGSDIFSTLRKTP